MGEGTTDIVASRDRWRMTAVALAFALGLAGLFMVNREGQLRALRRQGREDFRELSAIHAAQIRAADRRIEELETSLQRATDATGATTRPVAEEDVEGPDAR